MIHGRRVVAVLLAAMAALALSASATLADRPDDHCVHPDGVDLNDLHGTPHRIVTGFCTATVWLAKAGCLLLVG